jgi:hypothetical protein
MRSLHRIKLYLLSKPLDYWNSQQVGIENCNAQPSHWPNTETRKKPIIIKSHQNVGIDSGNYITGSVLSRKVLFIFSCILKLFENSL